MRARAISIDEEVKRVWQSVGLADRLQQDMLPGRPIAFVDTDGRSLDDMSGVSRRYGNPIHAVSSQQCPPAASRVAMRTIARLIIELNRFR